MKSGGIACPRIPLIDSFLRARIWQRMGSALRRGGGLGIKFNLHNVLQLDNGKRWSSWGFFFGLVFEPNLACREAVVMIHDYRVQYIDDDEDTNALNVVKRK